MGPPPSSIMTARKSWLMHRLKIWSRSRMPHRIDAALEQAYHSAAIYFPFADWTVADPYKEISDGLTLAYYIGQSNVIGGTTTDMVAYIDHGVFIQAWIGTEDKLPRLIHAIYLDDPERLRHNLVFSDWQLDP